MKQYLTKRFVEFIQNMPIQNSKIWKILSKKIANYDSCISEILNCNYVSYDALKKVLKTCAFKNLVDFYEIIVDIETGDYVEKICSVNLALVGLIDIENLKLCEKIEVVKKFRTKEDYLRLKVIEDLIKDNNYLNIKVKELIEHFKNVTNDVKMLFTTKYLKQTDLKFYFPNINLEILDKIPDKFNPNESLIQINCEMLTKIIMCNELKNLSGLMDYLDRLLMASSENSV